ncbi:diguanylate cyclase domain-containing protein [Caenimonas sp. SL110]|uniref:GGDEF domain-containing protein n=1 Tax=Caenimonas sp. SL110 TaxID=1450524 RepID=UPI00065339CB|nr:diguanylate cyclase [Caenimonas sp. SL110]
MTVLPVDPDELVALGAFAGVQLLILCLSVVIANAYRERALLVHGAAATLALLTLQLIVGGNAYLAQSALLMLLAVDGLQLLELVSHAGALRQPRRLMIGTSLVVLPLLAVAGFALKIHLLLAGALFWMICLVLIMFRAWPQSQPWARWLVAGQAALAAAALYTGWRHLVEETGSILPTAALLALWSTTVFLATSWRNRIYSDTKVRIDARNTIDPLTGLSMPVIFYDRVRAVRNLMLRYGHPSVIVLVHIEQLQKLAAEFGPEAAESALPLAANRIREALRDGDVAARLSHSRIAVLVEGMAPAEAAGSVASRFLVAAMKEPLPLAPTEFLHFRIVLAAVPVEDLPPKALLQRMSDRLDDHVRSPTERRIITLTHEELVA